MKKIITLILFLTINISTADTYFSKPNKNSAKLILDSALSTKSLSSVSLININGKEIIPRSHVVWLKAGEYKLKFSTTILNNSVNSGGNKVRNRNKNTNNTIKVILEANKTYYIAYDSHEKNINKWKLIVWKEE